MKIGGTEKNCNNVTLVQSRYQHHQPELAIRINDKTHYTGNTVHYISLHHGFTLHSIIIHVSCINLKEKNSGMNKQQ